MIIDKMPIKYNYSSRKGIKPKYIIIHDTGNTDKGAGAYAHYKYFNGGNRKASAHYFVDERIIETIEVSLSAWHCGDGHGRYGIWNINSIGIEMCINEGVNHQKVKENTLNLIRFLMNTYNIKKSNVLRHYDASRKICPNSMSEDNWKEWWIFKEMI